MAFALIALDAILRLAIVERKPAAQASGLAENHESWHTSNNNREYQDVSIQNRNEGDSRPDSSTGKRRVPATFTLLSSKRFAVAIVVSLVQAALTSSFDTILPLFVRDTFGWSSIGAGLIFLPIALPALVLLVGLLFCTGLCLNIILAPAMAEIAYVIEAKEKKMPGIFGSSGAYAQAYGLSCLAFAAGGLVGSIWAGMIVDRSGWSTVTWTLGLLSVVTAIPVVIWMGGRLQMGVRREGDEETIQQTP
ncbi:hypothetical protein ACHAPC_006694 [Botrytis cinerea]